MGGELRRELLPFTLHFLLLLHHSLNAPIYPMNPLQKPMELYPGYQPALWRPSASGTQSRPIVAIVHCGFQLDCSF